MPYTPSKEKDTPTYMQSGDFFVMEKDLYDEIRRVRNKTTGARFWTSLRKKYFPKWKSEV